MLLALRFIRDLKGPVTIHEFGIDTDGWAASHCQIGGPEASSRVIFDWLDLVVLKGKMLEPAKFDPTRIRKHHRGADLDQVLEAIHCCVI